MRKLTLLATDHRRCGVGAAQLPRGARFEVQGLALRVAP